MTDKKDDLVANIGEHCSVSDCNRLDFLPIVCPKCSLIFCKDHFGLTAHNCSVLNRPIKNNTVASTSKVNAFTCRHENCLSKEIIEFICEFCHLNFCKAHRLQHDHSCSNLPSHKPVVKKEQKEFNFEMKKDVSEKNKNLAAKLMVMKMRKTAVGPPGLPEELKFYCFVKYLGEKRPFYSSIKWPIGKFIEFLYEKLLVSKSLISQKKLYLNGSMVDSSLTCEELVNKFGLSPGVDMELLDFNQE